MTDLDAIRRIEEAALNAVPTLATIHYDGWMLRFADGFMRRANSVNMLYDGARAADDKIAYCESAYQNCDYPHGIVFKVTPLTPPDVIAALEARGYAFDALTNLETAALTGSYPMPRFHDAALTLRMDRAPSDAWIDAYFRLNSSDVTKRGTLARMLAAIQPAAGYAQISDGDSVIAVGLGVVEDGMIGLFDIVVDAAQRRRGIGRALVGSLLAWGREQGARRAYLQVLTANTPARTLYAAFGFTTAYTYYYLQRRLR
jgi:GNAT superfamily N-acetyltransferase